MRTLISIVLVSIAVCSYGQFTREQAIELVVTDLVGIPNLESQHTYSRYEILAGMDTLWMDSFFDYIIAPFAENWCFFIDLMPLVNWAHPCQYVFVCSETGLYEIVDHNYAPHPFFWNHPVFAEQWEWILSLGVQDPFTGPPGILFPNPACSVVHVNLDFLKTINGNRFWIQDLTGRKYFTSTWHDTSRHLLEIDVRNLPPGLYFLSVLNGDSETAAYKFIVSR